MVACTCSVICIINFEDMSDFTLNAKFAKKVTGTQLVKSARGNVIWNTWTFCYVKYIFLHVGHGRDQTLLVILGRVIKWCVRNTDTLQVNYGMSVIGHNSSFMILWLFKTYGALSIEMLWSLSKCLCRHVIIYIEFWRAAINILAM